ncbi:hypothetical protein [Paenibacillus sp. ATY16]|uniref:hypothetical protein n=1 Tax=Paenibacillus sp. ATY16 TaxID=1759312 RepID=UPI00200C677D|nr:hypothetical protein [Paenibacillus sp. ATY16]MCK9860230.1 hypothetical protein [Paenibacillus sp. ATY16]
MMKYIWLFAAAAVIILIEVPSLRKRKLKKDLWVFFCLLGLGIVLVIMRFLNLHIPNPVTGIDYMLRPLAEAIFHNLSGG